MNRWIYLIVGVVLFVTGLVLTAFQLPADAAFNKKGYDSIERHDSRSDVRATFHKRGRVTESGPVAISFDGPEDLLLGPWEIRVYSSRCGRVAIQYVFAEGYWQVATIDGYFGRCG